MSLAAQSQIRKPLDVQYLEDTAVVSARVDTSTKTPNVLIPIAMLIVFQILDALLTLKGISVFGSHSEGNPLLRMLIEVTSPVVGLTAVKAVAIIVLCCLFNILQRHPINWVPGAIWGINAIYFFGAIIPWTFLLV
jgi:hypothetical protein